MNLDDFFLFGNRSRMLTSNVRYVQILWLASLVSSTCGCLGIFYIYNIYYIYTYIYNDQLPWCKPNHRCGEFSPMVFPKMVEP